MVAAARRKGNHTRTVRQQEVNCEIFDNLQKFSLEKDERLVYGCLGLLPTGLEELLELTGLDIQALSRILAALLQKHQIEEVFKNHYKKLRNE